MRDKYGITRALTFFVLGWLAVSLYLMLRAKTLNDVLMALAAVPIIAVMGNWYGAVGNIGINFYFGPRTDTLIGLSGVLFLAALGWRYRRSFYGSLLMVAAGALSVAVGVIGSLGVVD